MNKEDKIKRIEILAALEAVQEKLNKVNADVENVIQMLMET